MFSQSCVLGEGVEHLIWCAWFGVEDGLGLCSSQGLCVPFIALLPQLFRDGGVGANDGVVFIEHVGVVMVIIAE